MSYYTLYHCIECGTMLCGPGVLCKECFNKFLNANKYKRATKLDIRSMYPISRPIKKEEACF